MRIKIKTTLTHTLLYGVWVGCNRKGDRKMRKQKMCETSYGKDELWNCINNYEWAYNDLEGVVHKGIDKGWEKRSIIRTVERHIYSMKDDFGRLPTTEKEREELATDFVEGALSGYSYDDKNRAWVKESLSKQMKEDTDKPYWYFTTHGVMPGSVPKNIEIIEIRDGRNRKGTMGTFVALDRALTTDELKRYDLTELAPETEAYKKSSKKRIKAISTNESMRRKPKRKMTEAYDGDPMVFMNTWANYNEYGADGEITPTGWMSIDEAIEYFEEYAEYEPFINDTDNIPEAFGIGEYSSVEDLENVKEWEDMDDYDKEIVDAICDATGCNIEEAIERVEDNDYYLIKADTTSDLAYTYIDEVYGGIENMDKDTLERYFDYEAFGRELEYDFIATDVGYIDVQ